MKIALLIETIILEGLGLISIIEGIRLSSVEKMQPDPLGPEFYNMGIGLILVILGTMYLVYELRKDRKGKEVTSEGTVKENHRVNRIRLIETIGIMAIYIFLIPLIGYLFASGVFFALVNRIVGFRSWLTNLVSSTVMAGCFYLVFVRWMGMIFS